MKSTDLTDFHPVFAQHEIAVETGATLEMSDITSQVQEVVERSGVVVGFVHVQSLHTSAGLLLNECESGLRHDLAEFAKTLVPPGRPYRHDDMSVRFENLCPEDVEFPNGHSHLQHALFGTPVITLAVNDRALVLGRWQRVLLVEYDRPRARTVSANVFGMCSAQRQQPTGKGPELMADSAISR